MRRAILPAKDYRTYAALIRRIRQLRPDIVHTHSSKAGILARWAAHHAQGEVALATGSSPLTLPKIIHTIHGLAFTASTSPLVNNAYKFLERRTAPVSDRIVCVADAMAQQSLAARIGTPDQYVTVYSGMETAAYLNPPVPRELVRQSYNIHPTDIVAGTIARLFDLKGHDDLLDLAPNLCAQFPRLKFMWVGDGSLRPKFERRIAQLNLTDRFILTGLVPPTRIPELCNAMDLLVHPSRREGLARALAQGGLANIPVVTYDIDGNREGLLDGQSGFLIPPFDRPRLADALVVLLRDDALRRRMGAAGRTFALARFDAKVMVAALDDVYRTTTRRNHR